MRTRNLPLDTTLRSNRQKTSLVNGHDWRNVYDVGLWAFSDAYWVGCDVRPTSALTGLPVAHAHSALL
jgi:hypothetical protein